MNVKELETRTGMARANIRYYESEGLIHPQRLPNGYRDYSEEDLVALEKIKLLRELGVEINTIRLLQEGSLSLQQVLFGQLNQIEGEQVLLDRQREVCRQLESLGLEYGALEPAPWLARLEAPSEPPALPQEEEPAAEEPEIYHLQLEDYEPARLHPWRRYFARAIDFMLCGFLLLDIPECLINLISAQPVQFAIPGLVRTWITGFVVLAIEPFLLRIWGWTPGKWLFGLKLRTSTGEKPSREILRERSRCIARRGYGYFIPVYNLYRLWKSYQYIRDGVEPEWNLAWDCRYELVPRRGGCTAGVIGYLMVNVAVLLITFLQPAVFWMNRAAHLPNLNTVEALYRQSQEDYVSKPNTLYLFDTPEEEPEHTDASFRQEPDGHVTATITKHYENEAFFISYDQELDAINALFGVTNPLRREDDLAVAAFGQLDRFQPTSSVVFRGMQITQEIQVEHLYTSYNFSSWTTGYEPTAEDASYTRTITITWTGDARSWFLPLTK